MKFLVTGSAGFIGFHISKMILENFKKSIVIGIDNLNNYYLPTASYWAVKDLYTNEYVIDYDDQFTQINADATSSYFDVFMNGLEPERYYTLLIKTTINGSTIVFDDQYSFKVING